MPCKGEASSQRSPRGQESDPGHKCRLSWGQPNPAQTRTTYQSSVWTSNPWNCELNKWLLLWSIYILRDVQRNWQQIHWLPSKVPDSKPQSHLYLYCGHISVMITVLNGALLMGVSFSNTIELSFHYAFSIQFLLVVQGKQILKWFSMIPGHKYLWGFVLMW